MLNDMKATQKISIHALHEESDEAIAGLSEDVKRFQSTLSMRRATESDAHPIIPNGFQSTLSMRRATLPRWR